MAILIDYVVDCNMADNVECNIDYNMIGTCLGKFISTVWKLMDDRHDRQVRNTRRRFGLLESGTLADALAARDRAKTCSTGTSTAPLTAPANAFLRPKAASTAPLMACPTSFVMFSPEPVTMSGIETSSEPLIMECSGTMPVPVPVMMAASQVMPAAAPDVMAAEVPKMKAAPVLMPCLESVMMHAPAGVAMAPTVSFEQFLTPLELARRG